MTKQANSLVLASLKKAETEALAKVREHFHKLRKDLTSKPKKAKQSAKAWQCPSCEIVHASDAFKDGWGCFDAHCMH